MSFRAFNKNLTEEIENLFATLGDNCLPEELHRLDENIDVSGIDIQALLRKVQGLDLDGQGPSVDNSKPNGQNN